jgi:hypothetical protein
MVKPHAKGAVVRRELVGVDVANFSPQSVGCVETIETSVGVVQGVELDLLHRVDVDVPDAGNVASLPGTHSRMGPKSNGLRLVAGANGRQKLFLKQQHAASDQVPSDF